MSSFEIFSKEINQTSLTLYYDSISFSLERDMFDQRNQQFSTILLATTIMLGALICCLAQGVLPNTYGLGDFIYYIYSISTSISVAFLFICLVFCVEVLWRASKFMYKRSKYNTGYLAKAIKKTKDMMGAIRGVKSQASKPSPRSHTYNSQDYPHYNKERDISNTISKRFARRRNISNMSETDVQREFVGYENETGRYHTSREAMIDESAFMVTADDGSIVESKSFERFWRESCSFYGNAAILFFYAGSAALFFVNVTFMWAVNLYTYKSVASAKLCAIVILVSLLSSIVLLIYIRYVERISMDNSAAADEAEGDKYSWGAFRAKLASISTSSGDGSFSRGMERLSSFMGSGSGSSRPRSGSIDSSVEEDSASDRYYRGGVTTQRRKERCSSRGGRRQDNLPVAVSLDIPLNYDDNFDELYGSLSSADATFPQTTYPTGTIDSRHVAVSTTR